MWFQRWLYVFTCMVLIMAFLLANGENTRWRSPRTRTGCAVIITVDPSGHGNFTTIQSAMDSISSWNSRHWTCVNIKSGVYREKVTIPYNKPNILLRGEGKWRTYVDWGDHTTLDKSPTLSVLANNFKAKRISFRARGISFTNSYNSPWSKNGNHRAPAVAAMIVGDKCSFYQCGFFGLQDTLWDVQGRHYFRYCTIEGAVDFIFGAGQSIYEKCVISVVGNALDQGSPGYITAQGRNRPNDADGFVFKDSIVIGTGVSYLGRPWRDYARVLFYNTNMSNIIEPSGWQSWKTAGHEYQLTFAEYNCTGLGSNTSKRVGWEKKLSWSEVERLIDIRFIDNEGWLDNQPV